MQDAERNRHGEASGTTIRRRPPVGLVQLHVNLEWQRPGALLRKAGRRAAMGARRFELRTSPLSGVRSSQLSYAPFGRSSDVTHFSGPPGDFNSLPARDLRPPGLRPGLTAR